MSKKIANQDTVIPHFPLQLLVETYAAISNRRGGTPLMPVWGLSLLYFHSHSVASS